MTVRQLKCISRLLVIYTFVAGASVTAIGSASAHLDNTSLSLIRRVNRDLNATNPIKHLKIKVLPQIFLFVLFLDR